MARRSLTDQAWLGRDECEMGLAPSPNLLGRVETISAVGASRLSPTEPLMSNVPPSELNDFGSNVERGQAHLRYRHLWCLAWPGRRPPQRDAGPTAGIALIRRRLRSSVTVPSWTIRLSERSAGSISPRFSSQSRTGIAWSSPMITRASERPTKKRRSALLRIRSARAKLTANVELDYNNMHELQRWTASNVTRPHQAPPGVAAVLKRCHRIGPNGNEGIDTRFCRNEPNLIRGRGSS